MHPRSLLVTLELYERVRKTPKNRMRNEDNYLIGLESLSTKGGVLRTADIRTRSHN